MSGNRKQPPWRALAASTAALLLPAPALGQVPLSIAASPSEPGWIALSVHAPPGTTVTITETAGGTSVPVATVTAASLDTELPHAVMWRCDRRDRRFVATTADGRTTVATARTPSCHRRLAIDAPARRRPGRTIEVRLRDRWRLGNVPVTLCVRPPGGLRRCSAQQLGAEPLTVRVRMTRPGRWRLEATAPWDRAHRGVRVARRGGRLRMLVTGDSMIQPMDDFLRRRLRATHVRVRSEPRISTGISKPSLLDWPAHARAQAARLRPDVTVMFLGANDGFPIGAAPCCGAGWVDAYAARVRAMMSAYARGGAGRVYWLALPAPRGGFFRRSFAAVNAALRRAAAGARGDARLIRLDRYFTPGNRYRATMRIGGHRVRVRQADGVHLSATGAAAAARLVARMLRRERIID